VEHFEKIIREFEEAEMAKHLYVLFYGILKTEGDIFVELN
jgi:hypothetical protein